jgi:hypothetical protein
MVTIMYFVRTRNGLRKCYITGRDYSKSTPLSVNANNGRDIDRTSEIADAFHGDKDGLNTYFNEKESSIRRDYREDSNSAAIAGVSASELHTWQVNRDDLLEQLNEQRDDVYDLASVTESGSSDEGENSSSSDKTNVSAGNDNVSLPNNTTTAASEINAVESNSNNPPYYPQDSSDVVQTDFPSFDPFEE